VHFKYRVHNPRRGGCNNRERRNLSPERPGPKVFWSKVHVARFLEHFQTTNNIIKYDGKTNPNVWLVEYHLACRAGGADDDFFIIQFFPIYLAVDHLPRNSIDYWEDLKEIL
jgi:hypothetical protein